MIIMAIKLSGIFLTSIILSLFEFSTSGTVRAATAEFLDPHTPIGESVNNSVLESIVAKKKDVGEIPDHKKVSPAPVKNFNPSVIGETVELPALDADNDAHQSQPKAGEKIPKAILPLDSNKKSGRVTPSKEGFAIQNLNSRSMAPKFKKVLAGAIQSDLELKLEDSPVLLRGNVTVPVNVGLKIKAGCVLVFESSASLWIWGSLRTEGSPGHLVEFRTKEQGSAALLFYGNGESRLEGTRLNLLSITQNGGSCHWSNCEFKGVRHYALASGNGLFTHCLFQNCGGVFATYNEGPWSLLMRKNIFDECKEGIILGGNPGLPHLVVEKNSFINTTGANVRVAPIVDASGNKDQRISRTSHELLIGENWYGTSQEEKIELRIVDRRTHPALKHRINIRQPAGQPYVNIGAGVSPAILASTLVEQAEIQKHLIQGQGGTAQANQASGPKKTGVIVSAGLHKAPK